MPLYRRLPKRGFKCRNSKTIIGINLSALEAFENDSVVSVETLIEAGIVKNPRDGVKILGNGELTKKLTVVCHVCSPFCEIKNMFCKIYTISYNEFVQKSKKKCR